MKVTSTSPPSLAIKVTNDDGLEKEVPLWPNNGPTRTDLILTFPSPQDELLIDVRRGVQDKDLPPGLRARIIARVEVRSNVPVIKNTDITIVEKIPT